MKLLKPILLVTFSLCLTLGFYSILSYFDRQKPPPVPIRTLAQTGPVKEALKTECLAELLGLSMDKPHPISPEDAEERLKKCPMIQTVFVSQLNPETLYIDYILRTPRFIVGDRVNLAIDSEGKVFPLSPYYTPKRLPKLYLGEGHLQQKQEMAEELLILLGEAVTAIDVSQAFAETLGKREVVVSLPHHLLRLTPKRYREEIKRYFKIIEKEPEKALIIDLRMNHLAYLQPLSDLSGLQEL